MTVDRPERVTIGVEKVSVTIYRKTTDDLLVSQLSLERWFATGREAQQAVNKAVSALLQTPTNHDTAETS